MAGTALHPTAAEQDAPRLLQESLARERELLVRLNARDEARDALITRVNHELRTPLTNILGYTDVLLDGSIECLSPQQQKAVTKIDRNGQRLLTLVENMLTLSGLEAGTFHRERHHVDLAEVVAQSLARTAPTVEAAGLDVRVDLVHRPSTVLGDRALLGRVVTSLVDNAASSTPIGGEIRVTVRKEPGEVVLEVADTGVGIDEQDQGRVFDPFARTAESLTRETQGLGLGLAVVGSIVACHDGRVSLSSAPGVGTAVTVRLPHLVA